MTENKQLDEYNNKLNYKLCWCIYTYKKKTHIYVMTKPFEKKGNQKHNILQVHIEWNKRTKWNYTRKC